MDMRNSKPPGVQLPANLEGVPITIRVFVPGTGAGDPRLPNGLQVLVKDDSWRSEYGTWLNLSGMTDTWITVQLTPSREKPRDGHMDPGFDPTRIIMVGLKIGGNRLRGNLQGPDLDRWGQLVGRGNSSPTLSKGVAWRRRNTFCWVFW